MANQKSTTLPPIDHSTIGQFNWTNNSTMPTSVITDTMAGSITGAMGGTGVTYIGGNGTYGTSPTWTTASNTVTLSPMTTTIDSSGKIELKGESADIIIDGLSLKATLEALHERLNWMQPNTKLEAEWDQLRELGDRYRELEKQCKEKTQMWTKLRTVPKTNQS